MAVPGAVLAGRYQLEARLGAGGMGEVWRATDLALGRAVAVKLMHSSLLDDPDFARRFRTEAQTMGSIRHPGVITVHDFHPGEGAADAFLVMELVEGESLAAVLRRSGRLPAGHAMGLLAQAADALHAAHAHGIVHRDVKPANLLVRPDGRVVLTDFGIARSQAATALTATGAVVGTLPYLAPEQVLGQPATTASDVYALGLVGYECLTGHGPFPRDNPFASAMARVQEPPAPLPPDVPPPVRAVVERALARDPAHRWPSAGALAAACRHTAEVAPTAVPAPPAAAPLAAAPSAPPGGFPPAPAAVAGLPAAPARGRWWLAGAAAAAVLLVTVGLVWVLTLPGDEPSGGPTESGLEGPGATPGASPAPASSDPVAPAADCDWLPNETANAPLVDVGTPPPVPVPAVATVMALTTNRGVVEVTVDPPAVPCTYTSMRHLAEVGFYDDTACHRLVDQGIYVLQCGDPSGTSTGGPGYQFAEENLPAGQSPAYPAGTVAMARTAAPATTGSQFFIVYEDTELPPDYTVWGRVTRGLDIVVEVAEAGHDDAYGESAGGGVPDREIVIESVRFIES